MQAVMDMNGTSSYADSDSGSDSGPDLAGPFLTGQEATGQALAGSPAAYGLTLPAVSGAVDVSAASGTSTGGTGSDTYQDADAGQFQYSEHQEVTHAAGQDTVTDDVLSESGSDSYQSSRRGSDIGGGSDGSASDTFSSSDSGSDSYALSQSGSAPDGTYQLDSFSYQWQSQDLASASYQGSTPRARCNSRTTSGTLCWV